MILSGGQAVSFPPQALAEHSPIMNNGWFYPKSTLELAGRRATYGQMYRSQPSIATLVDKVSGAEARLPLQVWDYTPAGGKVLLDPAVDPYARLISSPCSDMDPVSFYRWTWSTKETYGEAYWLKVRDDAGQVLSLMPMHPLATIVNRDDTGRLKYTFSIGVANAGILTVDEDDVVPFRRWNPDDRMRGMSRLEPLRTTLLAEDAARRTTSSMWTRGARPSFHLSSPQALSDKAQQRLKAQMANHTGPDRAGQVLVLEEGLKPEVIQIDLEKMMYVESRKLDMQECCMVYDVPPPVVHILDNATFSNITEQMRSMYRDTMTPRLVEDESVIDFYLGAKDFDPSGKTKAVFALAEVLRGDFEARATATVQLISNGVMKPAEARPLFDLDDAGEVADKLYGNAALVPLGSNPTKPPATGPTGEPVHQPLPPARADDEQTTNAPAKAGRVDARSLAGRLGRYKAMPRELRAQLAQEHTTAMRDLFRRQSVAAQLSSQLKDGSGLLDDSAWNEELAATLLTLSRATVRRIGDQVVAHLQAHWDPEQLEDWITSDAGKSAVNINTATADGLAAALRDLPAEQDTNRAIVDYFDGLDTDRAEQIGTSRVTYLGGAASQNAARQGGALTKTWVVTSGRPRTSHASIDGETVGIDELFSLGMNGPGDPAGGADEVAGCTCDLTFSTEASSGADSAADPAADSEGSDA